MERLRFGYETRLFNDIEHKLGPLPSFEPGFAKDILEVRRRKLLGDAVHVTADLLPEVHEAYQSCLDLIGGELKGDLFIHQSQEYNASVFSHEGRFDVLIHSALIKDFSIEEVRFVLGHELGHVIFGHHRFPVRDIISALEESKPEWTRLLFRWTCASEVSADRIGLLCCKQLATAVTALFKLSSGLSGIHEDQVLRSFRDQYKSLEEHIDQVGQAHGWVRTHPMMPIRFKALELAALDLIALRQQEKNFSWKRFQSIDQQISFIIEGLEVNI